MRSPEDAAIVARRILDQLSTSYQLGGTELFISASIGIATFPETGPDVDTLLENADAAMYQAKESGRNNFRFFNQSIHQKARRRLEIENGLRVAVSQIGVRPELQLHFQPKVAIPTGEIVGMEALLRWNSPSLGSVSPAEFIPVAEDTGLIVLLGEWVLRAACVEAKSWKREGLRIAVNISARQFREPGFSQMVHRILQESGLDPSMLEIELTEDVVMQDTAQTHRVLSELKAVGVRVALDDFGTGYSSLSYLTRFPIDILKIDRSFMKGLGTKRNDTIVSAIIALSRSLALDVVAEGVETAEQLAFLEQHGSMEIQGFLFSKPMAAVDARAWIDARCKKAS